MSAEENKELIAYMIDQLVNQGNINVVDEVASPDFVEHEELPPGVPNGPDAPKIMFQMMHGAFPDMHAEIEQLVAEGDMVVAYMTWSGTHEGEFMGIPATGNSMSIKVMDMFQVVDGQVIGHWGVMDMMGMMQQLGLMEG